MPFTINLKSVSQSPVRENGLNIELVGGAKIENVRSYNKFIGFFVHLFNFAVKCRSNGKIYYVNTKSLAKRCKNSDLIEPKKLKNYVLAVRKTEDVRTEKRAETKSSTSTTQKTVSRDAVSIKEESSSEEGSIHENGDQQPTPVAEVPIVIKEEPRLRPKQVIEFKFDALSDSKAFTAQIQQDIKSDLKKFFSEVELKFIEGEFEQNDSIHVMCEYPTGRLQDEYNTPEGTIMILITSSASIAQAGNAVGRNCFLAMQNIGNSTFKNPQTLVKEIVKAVKDIKQIE